MTAPRSLLTKTLFILAALGSAHSGLAQTLTIRGGDAELRDVVVRFEIKPGSAGSGTFVTSSGTQAVAVQISDGQGALLLPHLGKAETLTLRAAPGSPPTEPHGVVPRADGDVLKLEHWADGRARPLFDYQMAPGPVPKGVGQIFRHGAHLHPVYSPSGLLVTGNHPDDHRWHRGIWMAWTHTEFQGRTPDFWNAGKGPGQDKSGDQLLAEVLFQGLDKTWKGPVHGGFISQHRFIDHSSGKDVDVLTEQWEVTAYASGGSAGDGANIIDLVSTQRCAGPDPVKLPKYHYGGLGVRGNLAWNPMEAVTMLTSEGHDRKQGDGQKARWVHMGGELEGRRTGMVILIHPQNFRFPQPLRLNPKNPQLCIAPSAEGDWSIEPGHDYISRYRILILDGEPDPARLTAAWQAYAEPPKVSVE